MNILILMGGERAGGENDKYPIYLSEIGEQLILEEQVRHCASLAPAKMIFCVRSEDIRDFHVDDIVAQLSIDSICIPVAGQTGGAICTALLAAAHIDNNEELILMAVDDFIEDDFKEILEQFRSKKCDGGIVSFTSVHPRYSYSRLDENGFVVEVAEKHPISRNALASVYYFRKGNDFVECAKDVIRKDNRVNDSFYISQTVNEMILRQRRIGFFKISNNRFHPIKTEMQLSQYVMDMNRKRGTT